MEVDKEIISMSNVIKEYRVLHKLTQKEIAEELGIDTKYYGQIERGERLLTLQNLIHLCKFFKISLDSLILSPSEVSTDMKLQKCHLSEISNQLEDCNDNELAIINNLIHDVLLHLRNKN